MSARNGRFWVVSLATVFTMGVTAALGVWQLDRAGQKQALQAMMDARAERSVLTSAALLAVTDPAEHWHTPVQLSGSWVPGHVWYLDNRQMNGRPGFFVLSPLRLADSQQTVLVQRGWVARDFLDRTRVPEVETPAGVVEVRGRLAPPPARLWDLGDEATGPIRQNVDLAALSRETGQPLLPGLSVLQSGSPDGGLQQDWAPVATGVHKHHGYAAQWFGLCALTGILYAWFQWISPRRKQPHDGSQDR